MTSPDRRTLDYAGPRTDTRRTRVGPWRLTGAAVVAFIGAAMIWSADSGDDVFFGVIVVLMGNAAILIECVRGWRSRDE
jgi:uncharacterized membrane protein